MKKVLLVIDAERVAMVMARRATASDSLDGPHNVHALEEKTLQEMNHWLSQVKSRLEASDWLFAFSDTAHFRRRLFPDYQVLSRIDVNDSRLYQALLKHLRSSVPAKVIPGLEACDVLGVMMTEPGEGKPPCIGFTSHSRTRDVQGRWCGFEEGALPEETSLAEAEFRFYKNVLTGDPAESIEGCPGLSPEQLQKYLEKISKSIAGELSQDQKRQCWHFVVEAYQEAGSGEAAALHCARMTRVLRFTDYDWENKEVILWSPK